MTERDNTLRDAMGILDKATTISNPKRKPGGAGAWYDYYAGYSIDFVKDALSILAPRDGQPVRVLDPWNGSGTTTAVAVARGHDAIGIDRNPALVTIARARHLPISSVSKSLPPLRAEVVTLAKSMTKGIRMNISETDELTQWFTLTAVARLRALERATNRLLVHEDASEILLEPVAASDLSYLASFFYCALFTVTRELTAPFRTSNPTWVRSAQNETEHIEISWSSLEHILDEAIETLAARLTLPSSSSPSASLLEGSAESISLKKRANVVLTSPPYCTRIDYVIATWPELAIMGNDSADLKRLRREMLGSPLTRGVEIEPQEIWGRIATNFLEGVYDHAAKASKTYYYRYYLAYLDALSRSLGQIDRATEPHGLIGIVIQDSYFKEIRFDLPGIVTELGEGLGRSSERVDFTVPRTKAAIHPGSREYRQNFEATESIVVLTGKDSDENSSQQ